MPPYLKRTQAVDEFIPWLYSKDVPNGDMQSTLEALLGKDASGLSANTVSRLKEHESVIYTRKGSGHGSPVSRSVDV